MLISQFLFGSNRGPRRQTGRLFKQMRAKWVQVDTDSLTLVFWSLVLGWESNRMSSSCVAENDELSSRLVCSCMSGPIWSVSCLISHLFALSHFAIVRCLHRLCTGPLLSITAAQSTEDDLSQSQLKSSINCFITGTHWGSSSQKTCT